MFVSESVRQLEEERVKELRKQGRKEGREGTPDKRGKETSKT